MISEKHSDNSISQMPKENMDLSSKCHMKRKVSVAKTRKFKLKNCFVKIGKGLLSPRVSALS